MKNVLILGGSSDIGRAFAMLCAASGSRIMLAGRKEQALNRIASDIHVRYGALVSTHIFDARNYGTHAEFLKNLPERPDLVICVFGYLGDQTLACKDWEEATEILETNFNGAASILSLVGNEMEANGKGTIIGVSSVAGERGRMSNYFYGSAKAGFTAFLSGLRNRLYAANVHVVTVKPGFVYTKMTEGLPLPSLLTAKPEQVAKAMMKAVRSRKNTVYSLGIWRLIMCIIRNIPEFIFKKLKL